MSHADWGSAGCYCQTQGVNCDQGRWCPLKAGTEASNVIPLDFDRPFPVPKGSKPVNHRSSNNTLRFHRSMSDAFGCSMNDPVHPMPEPARPGLRDFFAAIGQVIARVFGR